MQTLQNGIEVPTNSDTYKLTEDLAKMGDTSNVAIPVQNKDARDALDGKFPGMIVCRLDLPNAPLETYDGTDWSPSDTPWTTVGLAWGFAHFTDGGWSGLKYAVRNGWFMLDGAIKRDTAWPNETTCAVVPGGFKPGVKIQGTGCSVEPTVGNIILSAGSGTASISATWPLF